MNVRTLRRKLSDVTEVCALLGLADDAWPQPSGGLMVRCPVHDDERPSCSVRAYADGAIGWRCFACNASGDVFHLIAAVEGLDAKSDWHLVLQAANDLADHAKPRPAKPRKKPPPPNWPQIDRDCRAELAAAPLGGRAAAYLDSRGVLELAREDGWAGTGEVLIPWRDSGGLVTAIQRRRIRGEPRYLFPRGRGAEWPYGMDRFVGRLAAPVAFVEGAIDVLALRRLNAEDGRDWIVLGLSGTGSWRPEWAQICTGRDVYLAFDADAAGDACADKIIPQAVAAHAANVWRYRPDLDDAKDWADVLRILMADESEANDGAG